MFLPNKIINKIFEHWVWLLAGLAFLLLALNIFIFYPGVMSLDSINQLRQALGKANYYDQHPPIMAFIWSIGIAITGKVSSMLVLQLSLLWASLLILSIYAYKVSNSKLISIVPLVFGTLPFVVNISATIWKDVQMAFSILLGASLILVSIKSKGKQKRILLGIAALSFVYALTLRYNAIFAVLPLVYLAGIQLTDNRKLIIAGCSVLLVAAVVINTILSAALKVEKTNPQFTFMLDDVVNSLSPADIQDSQVSDEMKDSLITIQGACKERGKVIHSYLFCSNPEQRQLVRYEGYPELKSLWFNMLTSKPFNYLKYRIKTFSIFMFTPRGYDYIHQRGIEKNELGQKSKNPKLARAVNNYVARFAHRDFGVLFRPYFWLLLSVATLVYSLKRMKSYRLFVQCLSISSILYIVTYFPVVIAGDYRYVYWSVLATPLALLLIMLDKRIKPTKRRKALKN